MNDEKSTSAEAQETPPSPEAAKDAAPAASPEAAKDAGASAAPAGIPAPRPFALAVDESRLQWRTYDQVFSATKELKKFDVTSCANGNEALSRLSQIRVKEPKPALILLEWKKPYAQALEFLGTLRKDVRWAKIPVLLVAATATDGAAAQEALYRGANDYLLKPIKTNLLAEKVNRLIGGEPAAAPKP